MVEIDEIEPVKELKEMKLEEILNDLYKKIDQIQATIGYILEKTDLIPKKD